MDPPRLTDTLQDREAETDAMTAAVYELDDVTEGRVLLDDLDLDLSALPAIRETLRQVPASMRKDTAHACYFDALDKILVALESAQ